jgi:hypothetical protein
MTIGRLIDRDDHSATDAQQFKNDGLSVLRRRHIECYLYDNEVIEALYAQKHRSADFIGFLGCRKSAEAASAARGNPSDDVKSIASDLYQFIKTDLSLMACGNDQRAFARNMLAPLLNSTMQVYKELREDIFRH